MDNLDNISINFIVSTSRTGSTLLSSMLNMHSNVLSISEEPFAYNLFPKYKNIRVWTDTIIEQYCYDFYLFSETYMQFQFGKKEELKKSLKLHQKRLTIYLAIKLTYLNFFPLKDKNKTTTIVDKELKFHHVISDMATWYPNSKYIILLRDPRDTVLINIKKQRKEKVDANLIRLAKEWNYVYKTLHNRLNNINKDRFIQIKYEDLVTDPENVLKKISSFIGIEYSNTMLNYSENIKKVSSQSHLLQEYISSYHSGLTQQVNTNKVGIWKTELSKNESDIIWSICKNTAIKNGYQKNSSDKIFFINIVNLYCLIHFYISNILIPYLYFSSPFILKYIIKKIKYRKIVYRKMSN